MNKRYPCCGFKALYSSSFSRKIPKRFQRTNRKLIMGVGDPPALAKYCPYLIEDCRSKTGPSLTQMPLGAMDSRGSRCLSRRPRNTNASSFHGQVESNVVPLPPQAEAKSILAAITATAARGWSRLTIPCVALPVASSIGNPTRETFHRLGL